MCVTHRGTESELQWGRVKDHAEGTKGDGVAGVIVTASMGPREGSRGRKYHDARKVCSLIGLQWGRVKDHAEGKPVNMVPPPIEFASMGPREGSRGRQAAALRPCRKQESFNGAA